MKKAIIFAAVAMIMVGCSSDELVNSSTENNEAPIAFSVETKNITRGDEDNKKNLEATGHYNFGVWAYKVKDSNSQLVMDNYLVGYSDGEGKGYAPNGATTWNKDASAAKDHGDHESPWFYEKLGTAEYLNTDNKKGYTTSQTAYLSANANQYLRYWDLAYTSTNFYAYTPYNNDKKVTFNENKQIVVAEGLQTGGYDDNSETEFLYAGAKAKNTDMQDVTLKFYHLGAKVNLQFYEDIPGYKVQLLDVTSSEKGIQATPATYDESAKKYDGDKYYTTCGANITFDTDMIPRATQVYTSTTPKSGDNLKFDLPSKTEHGLIEVTVKGKDYKVIPENPTSDGYAKSPTTYYAVAQPKTSEVGFTFHVSYKIIAEDNGEEITVHDARVYVPAYTVSGSDTTYIAAWQPNTAYTYTFKITRESTGTTKPNDEDIDPTSPTIPTTKALYPIVFDGATVEDYAPTKIPETVISE